MSTTDYFYRRLQTLATAHNYLLTDDEADTLALRLADLPAMHVDAALTALGAVAAPHLPFPSVNAIRKAAAQVADVLAGGDGAGAGGAGDSRPCCGFEGAGPESARRSGGSAK